MDEGTDAKDILENRLLPLRRGKFHIWYLHSKISLSWWHNFFKITYNESPELTFNLWNIVRSAGSLHKCIRCFQWILTCYKKVFNEIKLHNDLCTSTSRKKRFTVRSENWSAERTVTWQQIHWHQRSYHWTSTQSVRGPWDLARQHRLTNRLCLNTARLPISWKIKTMYQQSAEVQPWRYLCIFEVSFYSLPSDTTSLRHFWSSIINSASRSH